MRGSLNGAKDSAEFVSCQCIGVWLRGLFGMQPEAGFDGWLNS
jgi:hypothetical protein